jgi:hypothetical protein
MRASDELHSAHAAGRGALSRQASWAAADNGSKRGSRGALTSAEPHDSVRIVFDDSDAADDPIAAAILRAQLATMSRFGLEEGGNGSGASSASQPPEAGGGRAGTGGGVAGKLKAQPSHGGSKGGSTLQLTSSLSSPLRATPSVGPSKRGAGPPNSPLPPLQPRPASPATTPTGASDRYGSGRDNGHMLS